MEAWRSREAATTRLLSNTEKVMIQRAGYGKRHDIKFINRKLVRKKERVLFRKIDFTQKRKRYFLWKTVPHSLKMGKEEAGKLFSV